jgi:hypothetical protein
MDKNKSSTRKARTTRTTVTGTPSPEGITIANVAVTPEVESLPIVVGNAPEVVVPAVEVKPAPVAPVTKPKITNDELQISVKEFHAALGVPPSFRELNQQRLAAVIGEVKVSELKFDKATRDPAYLNQWMKWAISEYKKLAVTSKK